MNWHEQAQSILEQAESMGLRTNFFFASTFKRYQTQLKILDDLEKAIEEYGMTVKKEYVRGRENLCSNPAIGEYNKTSTAANHTVSTLLTILKQLGKEEPQGSKLMDLLNE